VTAEVQLDLFGEVIAHEEHLADTAARRTADRARYERRDFTAAYDTAGGTKKGDVVHGWVCPTCGGIEWSEYTLSLNHGYEPGRFETFPGYWTGDPWGTWCHRTIRRSQREDAGLPNDPADQPSDFDGIGVIRVEQ
jgi:hypothetical protein